MSKQNLELTPLMMRLEKIPCPICRQQDYEWGFIQQSFYIPGNFFRMNKFGNVMRARRCKKCQNVMHFVDESVTQKNRRLSTIIMLIVFIPLIVYWIFLAREVMRFW